MSENLIVSSPNAYNYPLLVKQLLTNSLSLYGDQEITYRGEVRYTYRDFRRRIGQLASVLEGLGVRHGATVAVMDWDSHRYLESYFAIPMMGATLFTVNVRLAPHQIAYTLNDSEAEIVLVHTDFLPMLESIKDDLTGIREVIVLARRSDGTRKPRGRWRASTRRSSDRRHPTSYSAISMRTPRLQPFTRAERPATRRVSTTATARSCLHTMTTAMTLCAPRAGQRLHREHVYMPITPMFHVLAWGIPFVAMTLGLKIVLPGRYVPDEILALKHVRRGHVLALRADNSADAAAGGRSVGAGPVRLDDDHRRREVPARAVPGRASQGHRHLRGLWHVRDRAGRRGRSDSDRRVTPVDADDDVRRRTHTGLPVPFVDLRVVDTEMRDVPRDGRTQGEIVLRAPYLTQGYFKLPQASEELWTNGYLHTQDVAVISPDGAVQIVDRIKDVIKTGGEWVSSIGLESLICDVSGGAGSSRRRRQGREVGGTADGVHRLHARRERRCGRGP